MTYQEFRQEVRVVRAPSSKLTKISICLAITFSMVTLLVLHAVTLDTRAQLNALRQQAQQLTEERDRLQDKIDKLGTLEGVEDIAKDELGLVDPDTVIIQPEN